MSRGGAAIVRRIDAQSRALEELVAQAQREHGPGLVRRYSGPVEAPVLELVRADGTLLGRVAWVDGVMRGTRRPVLIVDPRLECTLRAGHAGGHLHDPAQDAGGECGSAVTP
jgi:hypothetical protein